MATLELVPLRSKYPYTGHITVRYALPLIDADAPQDPIVEDLQDILDVLETMTTPKVAQVTLAGETAAGKGGGAR